LKDIFLSQNSFDVDGSTARYDSGRGLLLKGRDDGTFMALSGDQSGIKLYGEQRACAALTMTVTAELISSFLKMAQQQRCFTINLARPASAFGCMDLSEI